jgi:hypothetical protein
VWGICGRAVGRTVQLLLLGVVLVGGVSAAPAFGAEYTVVGCAGQPASTGGWGGFASAAHTSQVGPENCASAGGVMPAVLRNRTASGYAGWQVFAPAGTTIAGATVYRKVAIASNGYGYIARGVTPAVANYQVFENCLSVAPCAQEVARASFAWRSARVDVNRLQVYVVCSPTAAVPCADAANNAPASVRISRVDLALTDTSSPTVTSGPSSAMFSASGAVSGVQSIITGFKDTGAGIASTGVQVDGQTVSEVPTAGSSCRTPYTRLVPCPLNASSTLQFNPASVPDGQHQIRVFARDATGANVGFSQSFTITTSGRGALNGANGSDQVRLSVGVRRAVKRGHDAPTPRTTATVRFNTNTVAEGRLVNSAGQPIVGARLAVATAVDRGIPTFADLPANVITDKNGRYKVTVGRGPSQWVRVQYFARALDTAPAGRAEARVKVAAHATFAPRKRHLKRGQRAVFRGHIVGVYRPAGIRVELQGRRRHSYVTLSSAAARADGSYRVSYRFTHSAHGRFVFRLRVRHFPRFPYFLGYTRPVNVFVR